MWLLMGWARKYIALDCVKGSRMAPPSKPLELPDNLVSTLDGKQGAVRAVRHNQVTKTKYCTVHSTVRYT